MGERDRDEAGSTVGVGRRGRGRLGIWLLALAWIPSAGSCRQSPTDPALGEGDLRVLFVGNSLTYTNNLPGIVEALATADGLELTYADESYPNFGFSDHWARGIDDVIRRLEPDVVVLQQGPSSLDSSREYLLEWIAPIGEVVASVGGRSALFMVWPEAARPEAFDAVRENYAAAAAEVDGLFIPAGEAWRAAWARDPDLELYGPDDFHPSELGTLTAALTIYAMLGGTEGGPLPCAGGELVPAETAELLCAAVREAVGAHGVWRGWSRPATR